MAGKGWLRLFDLIPQPLLLQEKGSANAQAAAVNGFEAVRVF